MQRDILDDAGPKRLADSYPRVGATYGLIVLHRPTGLRGKIDKFTEEIVQIRDPAGREHRFRNGAGAFAVNGETVTLVRPAAPKPSGQPGLKRTASGALVEEHQSARVAKASRIWVEGSHDARMLERVWGDDLRDLGIVVEPIGGIDDLVELVREFGPSPQRRLAVLVDHLVAGSKESRIVAGVSDPNVLIVGHRYVDVWQCVRPVALGIDAWPDVPKGEEWKAGVCRRLGWGDTTEGWKRVLSAVDSFADLESDLVGAVERALDVLADAE
ncbi:MAG TPA: DUF3097 family protein [Microthrixaceae bacterium]|nr:DUF3097 family protein [Microthrixaceae bacterium]